MKGKLKVRKRLPKARCAKYFEDGTRCKRRAHRKSTLCKKCLLAEGRRDHLISLDQASYDTLALTKYDPSKHLIQYLELSKQGMSDVEIAAEFGVSVSTLQRWSETYIDFNTAYEMGKALHEAWWLLQGKANLNNNRFNTSLYKYLTGNKLGYSDKIESRNLNLNAHGVLRVPGQMSAEEWENTTFEGKKDGRV